MNVFKRSFLYVGRNTGRTVLLFAILLIVSTFVLSGLSVMDASEDTSTELRGTTGASFRMERNLATGGSNNQGGGMSFNTQEYVTDKMMEDIAAIDGIKAYTAQSNSNLSLHDANNRPMELIKTSSKWDSVGLNYTGMAIGSFYSEYDSRFLSNKFVLAQGRHITPDDSQVILLNEDLADKYQLKVGDKIYLFRDNWTTGAINAGDDKKEVEIIGLFKIIAEQPDRNSTVSYELYENFVFANMKTAKALSDWVQFEPERNGYETADFFVSDPEQLEVIIQNVQKIKSINWNNFNLTVNDEVYKRSASSMSNVSTLIRTLIIVVVIISAGIVSLILSMWLKGRMRETGIFVAAGISKAALLIQHMIETALIAIPAFIGTWFISRVIAGTLGNVFDASITVGSVTVSASHFLAVCVGGAAILLAAILVSCIPILRLKPREILSKMS